jgi:HPt (histidine-containing phosphotransfer) domain-containing protein
MASELERPAVVAEHEGTELWKLPESLLEFVNTGDDEMVAEILELFQQDSSERLRELSAALSSCDRESIRKQAHTLKGAALQVGATALSVICLELEQHAADRPEPQLADLVYRAADCFDQTCRQMTAANHR